MGTLNTPSSRRSMVSRGAGALISGAALAGGQVGTAAAHHSYPATYDTAKQVTVSGVVQLVQFTNPHIHVVIESPAEGAAPSAATESVQSAGAVDVLADGADSSDGAETAAAETVEPATAAEATSLGAAESDAALATTLWVLDLPAPARAQAIGLTPQTVPIGTPLTVVAWPSRSAGSHDLAPLTVKHDASGRVFRIR